MAGCNLWLGILLSWWGHFHKVEKIGKGSAPRQRRSPFTHEHADKQEAGAAVNLEQLLPIYKENKQFYLFSNKSSELRVMTEKRFYLTQLISKKNFHLNNECKSELEVDTSAHTSLNVDFITT